MFERVLIGRIVTHNRCRGPSQVCFGARNRTCTCHLLLTRQALWLSELSGLSKRFDDGYSTNHKGEYDDYHSQGYHPVHFISYRLHHSP